MWMCFWETMDLQTSHQTRLCSVQVFRLSLQFPQVTRGSLPTRSAGKGARNWAATSPVGALLVSGITPPSHFHVSACAEAPQRGEEWPGTRRTVPPAERGSVTCAPTRLATGVRGRDCPDGDGHDGVPASNVSVDASVAF